MLMFGFTFYPGAPFIQYYLIFKFEKMQIHVIMPLYTTVLLVLRLKRLSKFQKLSKTVFVDNTATHVHSYLDTVSNCRERCVVHMKTQVKQCVFVRLAAQK